MLLNVGITTRLSSKRVAGYEQTYWRLSLGSEATQKYLSLIGFKSKDRMRQVSELPVKARASSAWKIPHVLPIVRDLFDGNITVAQDHDLCFKALSDETMSRDRLTAIVERFSEIENRATTPVLDHLRLLIDDGLYYDKVVLIEEDEKPTFDVTLPETHSFWANGFVSHNTTIATKAAGHPLTSPDLAVKPNRAVLLGQRSADHARPRLAVETRGTVLSRRNATERPVERQLRPSAPLARKASTCQPTRLSGGRVKDSRATPRPVSSSHSNYLQEQQAA